MRWVNNNVGKSHWLVVRSSYFWELKLGKKSLSSLSKSLIPWVTECVLVLETLGALAGLWTITTRNLDVAQAIPADFRWGHLAIMLSNNTMFEDMGKHLSWVNLTMGGGYWKLLVKAIPGPVSLCLAPVKCWISTD